MVAAQYAFGVAIIERQKWLELNDPVVRADRGSSGSASTLSMTDEEKADAAAREAGRAPFGFQAVGVATTGKLPTSQ